MLKATITAYRGHLVFHNLESPTPQPLSKSLEALEVRAQRIVGTEQSLGISEEALRLLGTVTIKRFGSTANLAWLQEPGEPAELSWRGGPVFWSTPGGLLASIGSSLHAHVAVANEVPDHIKAQIDLQLNCAPPAVLRMAV